MEAVKMLDLLAAAVEAVESFPELVAVAVRVVLEIQTVVGAAAVLVAVAGQVIISQPAAVLAGLLILLVVILVVVILVVVVVGAHLVVTIHLGEE
jgi:hypothetical protein